ncbi:MAG: DUF3179 domain-containing protein [Chloroflexi bacterium]|nr:DUF3179 domain-containing protein [Chloroflexota bacterium]
MRVSDSKMAIPVNHTFGVKLGLVCSRSFRGFLAMALIGLSTSCVRGSAQATIEPSSTSVASPTVFPTATPRPVETRAQELMWSLFNLNTGDFFDALNPVAVAAAGDLGHDGLIAPIIEVSRFAFTDDAVSAVGTALNKLTGETYKGDDFNGWYAWLGRHRDLPVLPGYDEWKGDVYARLDPRFKKFFYPGVSARVPLWGAVWGGVRVDGIPPLNDPGFIPAADASYLRDDDVVLGVAINGDIRSYPHRILAWHELSNDVVGGRPVTLVY